MRHPWRGFLGVPGRLNHPGPTPIMSDSMEVGSVEVLAGWGLKLRWGGLRRLNQVIFVI